MDGWLLPLDHSLSRPSGATDQAHTRTAQMLATPIHRVHQPSFLLPILLARPTPIVLSASHSITNRPRARIFALLFVPSPSFLPNQRERAASNIVRSLGPCSISLFFSPLARVCARSAVCSRCRPPLVPLPSWRACLWRWSVWRSVASRCRRCSCSTPTPTRPPPAPLATSTLPHGPPTPTTSSSPSTRPISPILYEQLASECT